MLHFSNQELAQTYHVSVRTVRNWIEAARAGKLELSLHTQGKRTYVANTSKNLLTIEKLAQKGKKYRPHRAHRIVVPKSLFYDIYSQEQIYDIVSNLEIHHEIPIQYNYFDGGAARWDIFAERLAAEETLNTLTATIQLLEANQGYLDSLLEPYKQVNVIDIGVGNALPTRNLLAHLVKQQKLGRYIAIDISKSMLKIAEHNIKKWFGGDINFEGHELDISHERFTDLLVDEYIKKEAGSTINVALLLGGTLGNFRSREGALRTIHNSLGVNDLVVYAKKLDSASTRRFFDFNAGPGEPDLPPIFGFVVDLLNIDRAMYEVDMGYDEQRHERYERIILKVALTIKFDFEGGERLVQLNKDDAILVWRGLQQSALDVIQQFDQSEFYPLQMSQTNDQEYLLGLFRIKRD